MSNDGTGLRELRAWMIDRDATLRAHAFPRKERIGKLFDELLPKLTALSAVAPPPVLEGWKPIERDDDMDRTYIPLPGGWEVQTRGKGSTFRICDPKGDCLPIPDSPYLHETLERMAREVHAAVSPAAPAQPEMQAAPVAWMPIETAPKGQHVIIACRLEDQWTVGEAWQHEYAGWWWVGTNPGDGRSFEMHPDFWQALPPPPTGE